MSDSADQIRKLVALAASVDTPEARSARAMARRKISELDTELLDTLAGQRKRLLAQLREEFRRLLDPRERATKADTGELVDSAMMLLQHYEKIDALLPAVMLLRIEDGHSLTDEERQQLDGPVDTWLDRFVAGRRAERREARKARLARRRAQV